MVLSGGLPADHLQCFDVEKFNFPAPGLDDSLILEPCEDPAHSFDSKPKEQKICPGG